MMMDVNSGINKKIGNSTATEAELLRPRLLSIDGFNEKYVIT